MIDFLSPTRVIRMYLVCALAGMGVTRAQVHVFRGTSDASAAVAIQDNLFMVADDENNVLRVYPIADRAAPTLSWDMTSFLKTDAEFPEADIEGGARVGDRIYWITSHGRNRDGKFRKSRYRFFATRLLHRDREITLHAEGAVCDTLVWDLTSKSEFRELGLDRSAPRDVPLTKKQRKKLAPKEEGLNIEGLCASADGRTLFIGLRNPRPQRRAVVVPLINPAAVIDSGARPEFARPLLWDLRNQGIRAMVYSGYHGAHFIVAGPPDEQGDFVLYRWTGARADPPQAVQAIDAAAPDFTPEALVAFAAEPRLWLLSDDGARLVRVSGAQDCVAGEYLGNGTCQNKYLLDPMRKTFRGLWLPVSGN